MHLHYQNQEKTGGNGSCRKTGISQRRSFTNHHTNFCWADIHLPTSFFIRCLYSVQCFLTGDWRSEFSHYALLPRQSYTANLWLVYRKKIYLPGGGYWIS